MHIYCYNLQQNNTIVVMCVYVYVYMCMCVHACMTKMDSCIPADVIKKGIVIKVIHTTTTVTKTIKIGAPRIKIIVHRVIIPIL